VTLGLLAAACTPSPREAVARYPLVDGWTVREAGDSVAHPATVPGTVHTDLLAAGVIPDPYLDLNEAEVQWIEDRDWIYRLELDPPPAVRAHERLELVFDGLDTYADVILDGDTLLRADNMFRTWRVPLPRGLPPGASVLEVRFRSPVAEGLRRAGAHGFALPQGNDGHDPPTRAFTRKAAYHYGWDWGPRLVTSGLWLPARLEAWSVARILDVHAVQRTLSDSMAELTLSVTVEADRAVRARLQARSPRGGFPSVGRDVDLVPGVRTVEIPLRIDAPRRWWPRGLGEPHLYTAEVALAAGRRLATDSVTFGLRTLRLVTEPDSIGETFYFEVNGQPVFARGANLVPLDHFTPRVTDADWAALFDDVEAAHMNALRVWGGGVYPPDRFFDLADERGILVWQDFMFANALHPGDEAFLTSVRAEAEDQVRRLRNHASLALWCGNNEIAEGWANWGWQRSLGYTAQDSATAWADYGRLFEVTLPEVLARLDPDRPWWPSSPSIGWGHDESLARGDSHYWGVWWGMEPFDAYARKVPRFASEFGFQGIPDRATVDRFASEPLRALDDPAMRAHQKHPTGFETLAAYLERDLVVPPTSALDDWIYATQLLQAEGMRVAFEAHRRARPRTMGTLYWQLNDTWPVVSWSSRDHQGRWKLLHHAARRAFAPLLVSPVLHGDTLEVWIADDDAEGEAGTMTVVLHGARGDTLRIESLPVVTPAAGSTPAFTATLDAWLEGADPRSVFVTVRLETGAGRVAENVLYLVPLGQLDLPDPGLHARAVEDGPDGPEVELTTRYPAHFVHLDWPAAPLEPADDGFLLLPGQTRRVSVRRIGPEAGVEVEGWTVRSLADLLAPRR
jgi:beta-mannosidase